MWSTELAVETNATPEAVWRLWADAPGWPEWNADLAHAELEGPFARASTIRMTSKEGDTIELRIAEVLEPELFVDEADLGNVLVRTTHRLGGIRAECGSSTAWRSAAPRRTPWGRSSARRSAATSRTC